MYSIFGLFFTGYPYFLKKFRRQRRDILEARLMFIKAIAMRGEEAARLFYDEEKFMRHGAMPKRLQKTLVGTNSVQNLDNGKHLNRKAMFMKIMGPESLDRLETLFERHWHECRQHWQSKLCITLFDEAEKVLCRTACEWVGVPLQEDEVKNITSLLSALIDGSGAVGRRHLRGRRARKKLEAWLIPLIKDCRNGNSPKNNIFHFFTTYRDTAGRLPDERTVAEEVLNLIRPIVAIARYIVFAALALHRHPEYAPRLRGNDRLYENFVHEVRRYYPFFPMITAKVKTPFEHQGIKFKKGQMVLLDIYATNHDEKTWKEPGKFYPERFEQWNGNAFNFIPQGGGDHSLNHRCAGEWITIRLTKAALRLLNEETEYSVLPDQDLTIDMARIPAIPRSRMKIKVNPKIEEVLII